LGLARILMAAFGSYGDLHPYMAIGGELQRRGHGVTIASSPIYAEKVRSEGLGFHPVRPDIDPGDTAAIEYAMDSRRGTERVLRFIGEAVRESYEDTLPAARNADLLISHPITFGAVLAAQKLGMPWISSVLAPISLLSSYDPPVPAQAPWLIRACALGPGFMRAIWALGKHTVQRWLRPVVELRRELGLPDTGNPAFEGSHAPRLVLALFSRYFAAAQPDWPKQTVVTGFPFFDRDHQKAGMPPELERFMAAGPAPVVFTLGTSAVSAAGDFYRQSLQAVERLGARAVLLTGAVTQNLPERLPAGVITAGYVAHSEIFPRAAAIVHQGGIGTTAQAMRSGRPMVVVPFAHDQFDNAERVRRLGVARVIYRSRYNARTADQALREIAACETAAAALGAKVRAEDGAATAAGAIERNFQDVIGGWPGSAAPAGPRRSPR
jgi:rhamnosyltransferase subunit B